MESSGVTTTSTCPVDQIHFIQPWSSKFASGFDIFFDSFSNSLIFFKEGYFVVWDQFDRQFVSTSQPSGTA